MDISRTRRAPRGIALPMAVLAVALLTSLIAGAMLVLGSERRTIDTQDATVKAAALAQSAMRWFMNERGTTFNFTSAPPAASESTRINYTGLGYADVVLTQLRPQLGGDPAVYLLRSHAVLTGGLMSGQPAAERTVAEYAQFKPQSMQVNAGWTSLTGLTKNGGSGTLTGYDQCGDSAAVAGVAVPTVPGYDQNGGASVPTGDPPIQLLGTQSQTNASVKMDWDAIVNHGAITPNIVIPPGTFPTSFPAGYWPVIQINTSPYTLPNAGQGLIIAAGDLEVSGSQMWNGIMLVGGKLTANGNNTVEGAVISGLNMTLGIATEESDIGNGTKTYAYNSCTVARALAALGVLRPVENAWTDNWGGW
jgi:Tfp pilus assembly protein PilX